MRFRKKSDKFDNRNQMKFDQSRPAIQQDVCAESATWQIQVSSVKCSDLGHQPGTFIEIFFLQLKKKFL